MEQTIGIVGGGIVGLAVGREVTLRRPGTRVVVLEKEDRVGAHQTGHNSGVVHAGIYYRPGSLKATLCTRGRLLLRDYCAEHALPYDECGKVVVAVDRAEMGRFDALERTARENGVPGLRRLDGTALAEVEPHAVGLAALHSPRTAITDYVAVAERLAADIVAAGGEVHLSTPATAISRTGGRVRVTTPGPSYDVDRLVLCGGLQSDRLGRLAGGAADPRIVPFRGEYLAVRPEKRDLVRGMVYPVPDPRYPFLGVHFTRRVGGGLEVGPNAVLSPHRDAYRRRSVSAADLASTATWPGFWRMARQHWRTGVTEVRGSLSVRSYLRGAQRYVPGIGPDDVVRAGFGIRAQAVERDGTLVDDFRIDVLGGVLCLRNAPSPAATSSLAIAEHVADALGWA
ncbi:L-2-hydroxyglutarate oxidase LhgO [Nocardioides aromaticivorans]|uniref:L-2-hydroxyglutarate oxidase LhgO n=1 Tax=Nocardioides aromaticivorans TaxID=200618 RepID=A0A7Y9ZJA0_9ACTN|nr:L-2-hydroxyglutarate oxidase [Nocardioides aromaticivorans]NYI46542.1 L-2-hydroxyglutarate oxidase LhgO [Nocardioides aromaticivorans]